MAKKVHRIEKIVQNLSGLPSLPFIATKVVQVTNDPNAKAADIAEVISVDQSLSAKLVKLVNSSFYGFSTPILTVSRAIVVLGLETIKNLALGVTVFKTTSGMGGTESGLDMEKFWEHSVGVGAGARLISNMVGYKAGEEAFLAGLLHDIGKIVFTQYLPKEFTEALQMAKREQIPLFEAERKVIKTDHEVAGDYLAERWKLPHELRRVINSHHNPPIGSEQVKPEVIQLVCIVSLSNTLCKMKKIGVSGNDVITPRDEEVMQYLNIDETMMERFFLEIDTELAKAKEFLGIATEEEEQDDLSATVREEKQRILICTSEKKTSVMPSLFIKNLGFNCEVVSSIEEIEPFFNNYLKWILMDASAEVARETIGGLLESNGLKTKIVDLPSPFNSAEISKLLGIEVAMDESDGIKVQEVKSMDGTIMIVEDEGKDADLLKDILTGAGYSVTHVKNPEKTIVHVRQVKPKVIILALELNAINGLTLIQLLKTFLDSDVQTRGTGVIVVASFFNAAIVKKLITIGIKDIVKKPCNKEALLEKIQAHISK